MNLRSSALSMFLLALLLVSGPVSALARPVSGNWLGPDANYPLNWNYSPQGAIDSSDVNDVQTAWTFPIPAAPLNYSGAEGVSVTPTVVNGVVYFVTNWHRVYALNAQDGALVWFHDLPLWSNYSAYLQPSVPGPNGVPLGHYHQVNYTTHILGRPLVWVIANTYQVFALDANTGDIVLSFNPMAKDLGTLVGNFGIYDVDTPTMLIDQERGVLLVGSSVSESESSGRGFIEAWNVTTGVPAFMWRDYEIPPQDGSDPNWAIDSVGNMSYASVFNGTGAVDLKALPRSQLNSILYDDWGGFGFDGNRSYAGAGSGWGGSWAIDEQTGVAFVSTSNATPDWNATQRPGLDLWANSVLAMNLTTGKVQWAFQAIPHSLGNYDCSWNVLLANETIGGQLTPVVFKGCKDGYIFALDASNGHMLWYLKPPAIAYENFAPLNPLNSTQMTKVDWAGYPKTGPVEMNPPETGSLESDLAYDPTTGTLFAAVYNSPKTFQLTDVGTGGAPFNQSAWEFDVGQNQFNIVTDSPINATIMAVDATTGGVEWSYLLQNLPYRGGLTVSGGVVYVATMDGVLRFLSESDGTLLGEKNIGGSLISQPSIGSDTDGTEMLFLSDMGSPRWEPAFPGFVQGLVLVRSPGPDAAQSAFLLAVGATAGAGVILVAMYLRQSWKSPTPARSPSSSARPRGPGRTSCAGSSSDRRHRIGGRNRLPLLL